MSAVVRWIGFHSRLEIVEHPAYGAFTACMHVDVNSRGLGIHDHSGHLILRKWRLAECLGPVRIRLQKQRCMAALSAIGEKIQYARLDKFCIDALTQLTRIGDDTFDRCPSTVRDAITRKGSLLFFSRSA